MPHTAGDGRSPDESLLTEKLLTWGARRKGRLRRIAETGPRDRGSYRAGRVKKKSIAPFSVRIRTVSVSKFAPVTPTIP